MLANRPLADLPELRALATRIPVHRLEVTEAEMAAQMRRIAGKGWKRYQHELDGETALEVCEFVITECRKAHCPLDLRLLDNGCLDYRQAERGDSNCHWHDLVANRIRQAVDHFRHEVAVLSCEERKAAERDVVRDILQRTQDRQEQVRLWKERTGKSQSTFYLRKQQVELGEFDR
jgi:hypothetical protein